MKFINVLEDYKGYDKVFSAQVNLSSKEVSLLIRVSEQDNEKRDVEAVELLSQFKEAQRIIEEEIKRNED
jgi:phosphoheptose isomerase